MRIRVLGAHQLETRDTRLTSFLIDGALAIDAGSITASLTLEEQKTIQAILITHHHFDHTRDLLTLGLNQRGRTTEVYCSRAVMDSLSASLLNGVIYPKMTESPGPEPPPLQWHRLEDGKPSKILDYSVLPVSVPHGPPTFGYQVANSKGRAFFYTGDTGAGCAVAWASIRPHLLFIEVTFPNRLALAAGQSGHLTPGLVAKELVRFREIRGYMPVVRAVHLNPLYGEEIKNELKEVARFLEADLTFAHEGMEVEV